MQSCYFRAIKWYLTLQVQFVRKTPDGDQLTEARFRVPPTTLSSMTDYDKESFLSTIMNLIDNFVSVGSGWKVHHVMSLSISFAPYRPMQGSSYIDVFFNHLKEQEEFISDVLSNVVKMNPLTEEEQRIHMEAKNCKLCGNWFEHDKVRNHDHITGCYIGSCCNRWNLQLKFWKGQNEKKRKSTHYYGDRKKFCGDDDAIPDDAEIDELDPSEFEMNGENFILPVFFHNLIGFDSHIIMTYIDRNLAPSDIQVIPTTSEKYISFQIGSLRFLVSLQFFNASLDSLVRNLAKYGVDKFQQTQRHIPGSDLTFRKGNYCYEYMDSRDKFEETIAAERIIL